ncbi:hypothetical protein M422DRAFT_268701 [Sphaerobolus stellatus SS14]|uniref:Unplaced genomic scaffold SPHSTscaffold_199, whole genome shotgun sequence n=1 Tax=Sphaerobolus stellatus (strain SS14) TaxID=990650 RepID=A0A0C9UXF3_SPHS4|nr:hypothetical protein M422DRAFT_268701 [Sphaerobolus stellatus SS14]
MSSFSEDTLKSVKTFRMSFSPSRIPAMDELQTIGLFTNLDKLQILLQLPAIPSGRLYPSPASVKSLSLKKFTYEPPTFSFDEIFRALGKIRTGKIIHFGFQGFHIETTLLTGTFKKFNGLVELEFIDCRIMEGVLNGFAARNDQVDGRFYHKWLRVLRILNSNFPGDDLRQLLDEQAKGDSAGEEELLVEVKLRTNAKDTKRNALLSLKRKYPHVISM